MTTDLRDKTVAELRFVKINTAWLTFLGKAETIPYSSVAMEAFDELARRLAEAEQKIAERDAMLAQCVLIGRNILLALTPDLPKDKRPTFEEFSNSIQSLPASAKANAEILRAARKHHKKNNGYFLGPESRTCSCSICKAVRAAKESK